MRKMYQTVRKAAFILLLGFIPFILLGQNDKGSSYTPKQAPYWYIGAQGGLSQFHGDIVKYKFVPDKDNWNFGFGGLFGRQFLLSSD